MIEQLSLLDEGARPMDVVDLVANDPRKDDEYKLFLSRANDVARMANPPGIVSPNWMRRLFSNEHGLTIEPRRYSSFWRRARLDGHLARTGEWETNQDWRGRNSGKPQPLYRWVGTP
jgi:hypothetical protein